jgi:tetrachlorobenzoquinone reductase
MTLELRVQTINWEAPEILSYDLRLAGGGDLPPFTAGAHIDLTLPNGLIRSYSLVNPPSERHRYLIAVQKDRASRGGSKWIHEHFRTGDVVTMNGPRNNFELNESAERSIFIAGGIGITPILSMIARLTALGRNWQLIYCARKRSGTAFLKGLEAEDRVRFNFDEEPGGKMLDVASVVRGASENNHLYCCGPRPMLEAFERATAEFPRDRVHVEYFTAKEPPAAEGGFKVVLSKTGREFEILAGKTILATLLDNGVAVPFSCKEGVCGACETRVLEGIPDHRDLVLTEAQHEKNDKMMICCSGSKTAKLILDI